MKQTDAGDVVGRWDYGRDREPWAYGDDVTYAKGIGFLDGHGLIEDWGCGTTYARKFVRHGPYIGIDGSASPFADKVCDLRSYRSAVPCIFMRHILEHNLDWRLILEGALASFQRRMALIMFTPFAETTHVMAYTAGIPDLSFRKGDIVGYLDRPEFSYVEERLTTATQYGTETVFYIEKAGG